MGFTNSPLVSFTKISPNRYVGRKHVIDTITPHVVVGHLSLPTIGNIFANKKAQSSCNYAIDDNGDVGLIVEEKDGSWCTSSKSNDMRAITIEIACDQKHPYAITDAALRGLIDLSADVCKRNGIPKLLWKADKSLIGNVDKQNISVHRWFANKACPGEYVFDRLDFVADEVNKLLLPHAQEKPSITGFPYTVKIDTPALHYRAKAGVNYPIVGMVHKGEVYTIVEEAFGKGASKWGKLKSGAGWIALDFCKKIG